MIARAIALASVVQDDAAALERLPARFGAEAVAARARLLAAARAGRGAVLAREALALFAAPPGPLPSVLARAPAAAPDQAPPADLDAALADATRLGRAALALALAGPDGSARAELLRRLPPADTAIVLAARPRAPAPEERSAAGLVLDAATLDPPDQGLLQRLGLTRIAWAATVESGALHALAARLPAPERSGFCARGELLWFADADGAAAERARIARDLGAGA